MKLKNRILFLLFIIFMSIQSISYAIEPPPTQEEISGEAAILMENETGKILYEKNAYKKMYPASTTKVMTALLALEKLDLDKKIAVPPDFPQVDGSSMYLLPGEEFTVNDLIRALLIHSSNDVAVLLAMEISGSVEEFAKLMNERAVEIGCTGTHYSNPHGLHDDNHYTTVYDMALISREAMKNENFRKIVAEPILILEPTDKTPEKRIYNNTNRFLWSNEPIVYKNQYIPIKYDAVDGIKTGFTLEAQKCLASTGIKNGIRMIAVVYKTTEYDVFRDSRRLLDYGFDNFKVVKVLSAMEQLGKETIKHSVQKDLKYAVTQDISYITPIDTEVAYDQKIELDELKLPIEKGQKVGKATITIGDDTKEYELVALDDVESVFTFKHLKELITSKETNHIKRNILIGIIVFIILIIILRIVRANIKRKKRKKRYKKL